jgi:DNA-binding transcriptional regulator LsrR (DeoR family)
MTSDRLPADQQQILAHWSADAIAEELHISRDAAIDLLNTAYQQGRVEIKGNDHFAGVMVDGRWVVVEGRYQLQQAALEWLTLQFMERQLDE